MRTVPNHRKPGFLPSWNEVEVLLEQQTVSWITRIFAYMCVFNIVPSPAPETPHRSSDNCTKYKQTPNSSSQSLAESQRAKVWQRGQMHLHGWVGITHDRSSASAKGVTRWSHFFHNFWIGNSRNSIQKVRIIWQTKTLFLKIAASRFQWTKQACAMVSSFGVTPGFIQTLCSISPDLE